MVRLATAEPLGRNFTSGSLPTLPRRMTLLTLLAMDGGLLQRFHFVFRRITGGWWVRGYAAWRGALPSGAVALDVTIAEPLGGSEEKGDEAKGQAHQGDDERH